MKNISQIEKLRKTYWPIPQSQKEIVYVKGLVLILWMSLGATETTSKETVSGPVDEFSLLVEKQLCC